MLKMCGQESSEMQDSSMTVTWKMPDAPENEMNRANGRRDSLQKKKWNFLKCVLKGSCKKFLCTGLYRVSTEFPDFNGNCGLSYTTLYLKYRISCNFPSGHVSAVIP